MATHVIEGEANWAFTKNPNTRWEHDKYEITLFVSQEEFDKFTDVVDFHSKFKDGKFQVKLELPVERADGKTNEAPKVFDADNNPFDDLIGNGSKVRVKYRTFTYKKGKVAGKTRAYLDKVQVLDLVPYEGGDDTF